MTAESVTGALVAISLFLGAGLGLTLCLPGFARTGLAGRLGFAWVLGVAWIGLFLYAASHFARMRLDGPLVFLAAFLPLAAGLSVAVRLLILRRWRAPAPRRARRPLWALCWVGLSLLAVLVSSAVLANALTHPFSGEQFKNELAATSWNYLIAVTAGGRELVNPLAPTLSELGERFGCAFTRIHYTIFDGARGRATIRSRCEPKVEALRREAFRFRRFRQPKLRHREALGHARPHRATA